MVEASLGTRVAAAISSYADLIASFVRGDLSADDFQTRYFDAYLDDASEVHMDDETFDVVDGFFAFVDSYVADVELRSPGDPTDEEVRDRACQLLVLAGFRPQDIAMTDKAPLDPRVHSYLRQEIEDLLDAGLVGLYELPQFIPETVPEGQRIPYAAAVLAELINGRRARLVWARWASGEPPVEASEVVPTDRDWAYPPEERYLALEPIDPRDAAADLPRQSGDEC